jgi:hypothetical protein
VAEENKHKKGASGPPKTIRGKKREIFLINRTLSFLTLKPTFISNLYSKNNRLQYRTEFLPYHFAFRYCRVLPYYFRVLKQPHSTRQYLAVLYDGSLIEPMLLSYYF